MGRLQLSLTLACLCAIASSHYALALSCALSSRQVTQLRGCTFVQPVTETSCVGSCRTTSQTWLGNDPNMEYINCFCCQASASRQVTVEMECPGRPYEMFATCDNKLTVWFDGVRQDAPADQLNNWQETSTFSVPPCTRVVAVECEDTGGPGAILASLSNGDVTDSSWDCSKVPTDNWQYPGFVADGDWQAASVYGLHGTSPWGNRPDISDDAEWIWTSDYQNDNRVFCRKVVMDETADCTTQAENGLPEATTMTATCDNQMRVYFDDTLQTSAPDDELNNWTKTSTFAVPPGTQKVAIDCLNTGGPEGILASFDNGLLTDDSWECHALPVSAAVNPEPAFVIGLNGVSPWNVFNDINANAEWIWTATTSDLWVRCSKDIASTYTPFYPVTRVPFTYTVAENCNCISCGDNDLPPWSNLTLEIGPRDYLEPPCCV